MKKENGITLVEILLAIALTSVVIAVMISTYTASYRVTDYNSESIGFQEKHRLILTKIGPDVREAIGIDVASGNETVTISTPSNGDIEYRLFNEQIRYTFLNTGVEHELIDEDVKELEFNFIDNVLTMRVVIEGDGREYEFTDRFYPRVKITP